MSSHCFGSTRSMTPEGLMHEVYGIKPGAVFSQEDGGQWVPGEDGRILFKGVLLPVSNKDLVRSIIEVLTQYPEKIYTNGRTPKVGTQVEDSGGIRYTATQELGYSSLHPLGRYLVERRGKATKK